MLKDGSCPHCGSRAVMADLEVRDEGRNGSHPLRVVVEEPPPAKRGAVWVQGQALGDIRAWICSDCGYTELYTGNLPALRKAYQKSH